jgi:hypothetical protein
LRTQYEAGLASKKDLRKKRDEVRGQLSKSEEFYEELKKEYDIKLAVYEEQQKKRGADDEYVARLEQEVLELKNNLDDLNAESKQLASIDERLTI